MVERAQQITDWCTAARRAGRVLARAGTAQKDEALRRCAARLRDEQAQIIEVNARDIAAAEQAGLSAALVDRLRLTPARVEAMASACEDVARLPDPVGAVDGVRGRPSGIRVGRMRAPLGTILVIFESRPNVTIDAAALCLKAGNAVILRGGKEARHSNRLLAELLRRSLDGLDADAVQLVDDPDRELLYAMLKREGEIDLVVPRGGEGLIRAVTAESRIPVVQHYQGICHVYVDLGADLDVAERVVLNAKTQRPGVCNAIEGLLIHAEAARSFVPRMAAALDAAGVELRGCARTCALAPSAKRATPEDFDTEFLDLILAAKVVDTFDEALSFLAQHGSNHTEAIVTRDHARAERFLREVDASCVLVNASTRFNDGGELGLGAEIGISTTKVHAYGPMGLEGLTCQKFVVYGSGEVRV